MRELPDDRRLPKISAPSFSIILPLNAVPRVLSGRQTRYRIPAACYAGTRDVQKYTLYDTELDEVFVEARMGRHRRICKVQLNNPFKVNPVLTVKEPFYTITVNNERLIVYAADWSVRRYRVQEPTVKLEGVASARDVRKYYGLAYTPNQLHAKKMPLAVSRLHLDITECGVEYFNSLGNYYAEGYSSIEESLEDWERRYKYRPDFDYTLNPLCFYGEFDAIID